jgi:hypothetical protein
MTHSDRIIIKSISTVLLMLSKKMELMSEDTLLGLFWITLNGLLDLMSDLE